MKKKISKTSALIMAVLMMFSCFSAFGSEYANSIGSEASDIGVLNDSTYTVTGNDATQNKKSEYTTIAYADSEITSKCDVYATVAEGEDVYQPTIPDPENPGEEIPNPDADEDGFVDGKILIGIPVVLIMSGTPDSNGYYVAEGKGQVKGNVAGTTVINVIPEDSFTLSQSGKADITATVTQDFTKFVVSTSHLSGADVNKNLTPAFNDNCNFTVQVKTNQATAGSWHGAFGYSIYTSTAE